MRVKVVDLRTSHLARMSSIGFRDAEHPMTSGSSSYFSAVDHLMLSNVICLERKRSQKSRTRPKVSGPKEIRRNDRRIAGGMCNAVLSQNTKHEGCNACNAVKAVERTLSTLHSPILHESDRTFRVTPNQGGKQMGNANVGSF